MNPASNTNFDNGLTPSTWAVEQYSLTINQYGDTLDLNMVTEGVGIANQFLVNAKVNGIQAMQSLDRLARDALFGGKNIPGNVGGYLGGNTRVSATLAAAGASLKVDDIRGFQVTLSAVGQTVVVSAATGLLVTVGQGIYTLMTAVADSPSTSSAASIGGISGTLIFTSNVSVSDGTLNNPVIASTAPLIVRPNGKQTTAALTPPTGTYGATSYVPGDTLTLDTVHQATAALRMNNVPPVDASGLYHCYLDDQQIVGLFRDQDFKYLYRGAFGSETYITGQVFDILGIRFIPTTEAPQQNLTLASGANARVHRAIVCGQGALVEANYVNIGHSDIPEGDRALMNMVDSVCMVTREPLDRLKQIIAQSWYWIGGYALPTDATATPTIIPTATNSNLKRAVVLESL